MRVALSGRPIAITGASSGIGRETALCCARAGMPVALGARRQDRLIALVEEIRSVGGNAIMLRTDVTSPADCQRLIDATVEAFGSIYAVFANAGYGTNGPLLEMTDADLRAIFETNFFGTLNTIRPAVDRLRENPAAPRGHVILCSSCVARLALPHLGAYSATKAAQAHVGSALREEIADEGIFVSTVHPIATRTEFFDAMHDVGGRDDRRHVAPAAFTQPATVVAARVVQCLRRPRPEVWTGPKGAITRCSAALMTALPRFGAFVARRTLRNASREANGVRADRGQGRP